MGILHRICKDNGIRLCPLTDKIRAALAGNKKSTDGYAVDIDGNKIIFYDASKGRWNKTFIASHELAHLLLEHLTADNVGRMECEAEANIIAAVFTALLLWDEYRSSDKEEIA